jgi:hypothetical protein
MNLQIENVRGFFLAKKEYFIGLYYYNNDFELGASLILYPLPTSNLYHIMSLRDYKKGALWVYYKHFDPIGSSNLYRFQ